MSCTLITEEDLRLIKKESSGSSVGSFVSPHRRSTLRDNFTYKSKVIDLPRGGSIIESSIGNIQYGMPPDTVKDSLNIGLDVPRYFIIPTERFDTRYGLSCAEFEFPAYFNFFIKKQKVRLICSEEAEKNIRIVFQETLLGPLNPGDIKAEGLKNIHCCLPNLLSEGKYFAKNPFNPGEALSIDTLLEFRTLDPQTHTAHLEGDVYIKQHHGFIVVIDKGEEVAMLVDKVYLGVPQKYQSYDIKNVNSNIIQKEDISSVKILPLAKQMSVDYQKLVESKQYQLFVPPQLGITVIGSSHGFDPKGSTSGYVFWINGRGIMVDPPPFSSLILRDEGIPPHLVETIIITHCHADHDSGTFQKILDSSRVEIITTNTIMESFLRKYSALSGMKQNYLKGLFKFRPAILGKPTKIYGASFNFFYSFHTIPCIGFELNYLDKSIYFSGDTFYDPNKIKELAAQNIMTAERAATLANKNWNQYSLIIHEAGVPPIHTPLRILKELPEEIKKKTVLVHIAKKDVPQDIGIRVAEEGIQNTIIFYEQQLKSRDLLNKLKLLSSIPIFESLSIRTITTLLEVANEENFQKGEIVIQEGSYGDKFYIIESGVAQITSNQLDFQKYFLAGDYFGEKGVISNDNLSMASVIAITNLLLLSIDKHDFEYIFGDDNNGMSKFTQKLFNINQVRGQQIGKIFKKNKILSSLNSSQKIQLEAILHEFCVGEGDYLWKVGDPAQNAFFVAKGSVCLEEATETENAEFEEGCLVCDLDAVLADEMHFNSLMAIEESIVYKIEKEDLVQFANKYPGFRLILNNNICID